MSLYDPHVDECGNNTRCTRGRDVLYRVYYLACKILYTRYFHVFIRVHGTCGFMEFCIGVLNHCFPQSETKAQFIMLRTE